MRDRERRSANLLMRRYLNSERIRLWSISNSNFSSRTSSISPPSKLSKAWKPSNSLWRTKKRPYWNQLRGLQTEAQVWLVNSVAGLGTPRFIFTSGLMLQKGRLYARENSYFSTARYLTIIPKFFLRFGVWIMAGGESQKFPVERDFVSKRSRMRGLGTLWLKSSR